MLDMPPDQSSQVTMGSFYESVEIKDISSLLCKNTSINNRTASTAKGIIKIPPQTPEIKNYNDLIRSEKDEKVIEELITTMANTGKIKLLFNKHYVEDLGDQIRHVYPLRFLGLIFSKPHLKECMKKILDDYFKKSGFIDGLSPSMDNELKKGKLHEFLNDFCKEVNVKPHQIQPFLNARDWEGLIYFLANN